MTTASGLIAVVEKVVMLISQALCSWTAMCMSCSMHDCACCAAQAGHAGLPCKHSCWSDATILAPDSHEQASMSCVIVVVSCVLTVLISDLIDCISSRDTAGGWSAVALPLALSSRSAACCLSAALPLLSCLASTLTRARVSSMSFFLMARSKGVSVLKLGE